MKLFGVKDIKKGESTEDTAFRRQLLEELDIVTEKLSQIRESYDMTDEPELVDALIYEELAMKARYDYLIRTAKERNIRCRLTVSE
ncbi:MAG: YaaL family protein [Oscillospiraceae bacterium]